MTECGIREHGHHYCHDHARQRPPPGKGQLELLAQSTRDAVTNPQDITMGLSPDRLGFGVRADRTAFAEDSGSR
ncbi:MAG: hypothetical protein M3381_07300 [Actinomycetota bacterium]|nr:hypothetical protein [Actinomycetota bacterium]